MVLVEALKAGRTAGLTLEAAKAIVVAFFEERRKARDQAVQVYEAIKSHAIEQAEGKTP